MDEYNNDYYSNPQGYDTPQDPQYYDNQQGYDNQQPQYYDDGQQYYDNQPQYYDDGQQQQYYDNPQPQYNDVSQQQYYDNQQQGYNNQPQGGFQNQGAPYQNQPQQIYGQPQQPSVAAAPKKKKKTKLVLAIVLPITALVLIIAIVAGIFVVPMIFVNPESLMDQQKYTEAYEIANEDQKFDVLAENVAAHVCASHTVDNVDSFELSNIIFNKETNTILLSVESGSTTFYYYYFYVDKYKDFRFMARVEGLTPTVIYPNESLEEKNKKILINALKKAAQGMLTNKKYQLSNKNGVKRINKFYKENRLNKIDLIEGYEFRQYQSEDSYYKQN